MADSRNTYIQKGLYHKQDKGGEERPGLHSPLYTLTIQISTGFHLYLHVSKINYDEIDTVRS